MFILVLMIGVFIGILIMCLLQINKENKECLHCGKGAAVYCEKCYQDLISENAKLQSKWVYWMDRTNELMKNKNVYADTDSIEKHIPRID